MSKSLLKRLYNGEIYPAEAINCRTTEYVELNRKISAETDHFKAILSSDDWRRFEELDGMKVERSSDYTFANFTYGFRLGAALMIEVFAGGAEVGM